MSNFVGFGLLKVKNLKKNEHLISKNLLLFEVIEIWKWQI